MKSAVLSKLQRLLGMASAAEASRLAGVVSEIAACHDRADGLRSEIASAGIVSAPRGGSKDSAELAAASRWGFRLAERARAEETRAEELEREAAKIRLRLARAFGRESAAAAMAEKAHIEERRLAAQRAEDTVVAPARAQDQPVSSGSNSDEASAGSPGIA